MGDIFSELRYRLYAVQRDSILTLSQVQYESTIKDIIEKYFENRENINIEILENLVDQIQAILTDEINWIHRINLTDIKEDNIFENLVNPHKSFKSLKVKKASARKQRKQEFVNELEYYKSRLNELIEETHRLNSQAITTDKNRLKFNLQITEVVGFMRLLKEANIINVDTNKELCKFIAQNFSSSGKESDYSLNRLEKLMSPTEDILSKLDDILQILQKKSKLLQANKQ